MFMSILFRISFNNRAWKIVLIFFNKLSFDGINRWRVQSSDFNNLWKFKVYITCFNLFFAFLFIGCIEDRQAYLDLISLPLETEVLRVMMKNSIIFHPKTEIFLVKKFIFELSLDYLYLFFCDFLLNFGFFNIIFYFRLLVRWLLSFLISFLSFSFSFSLSLFLSFSLSLFLSL